MSDAKTQQKKKQLMIVGVIVVAGVLFFLRLVFWKQEFKTTIAETKNQPNETLKNFSNQWQEIRSSMKTKFNEQKTASSTKSPTIDAQTLETLKKNIEEKTKTNP